MYEAALLETTEVSWCSFPPSNAAGASEPHRGTGSTVPPLSGEVVYSKGTESHISLQHGAPLHSPNHKGGQVECNCLQKKLQRAANSQSLDIWTLKKERDSNHDGRWQSRRNRALLKGNVNYVAAACWTKNTGGLWDNSSSLWLQGCWVRRRGTRCQSRCLRASDCEPWT